jgi:hypothetical protein
MNSENREMLMKRITIGLISAGLGLILFAPCAGAQSWGDIQYDRAAIATGRAHLRHDRHELRRDLRHGDYAAAAREQAEMNRRRARLRAREEDLNGDLASRYYRWHRYY